MDAGAIETFPESSNAHPGPQFRGTQSGLRSFTEISGSAVVIHVGGAIDASNQSSWQCLVGQSASLAIAPGPFVVDVRDLEFMGSGGYGVLAREAEQCQRRGVNLRLVSSQPVVARTIAACGLQRLLPLHPSVDAALSPAD